MGVGGQSKGWGGGQEQSRVGARMEGPEWGQGARMRVGIKAAVVGKQEVRMVGGGRGPEWGRGGWGLYLVPHPFIWYFMSISDIPSLISGIPSLLPGTPSPYLYPISPIWYTILPIWYPIPPIWYPLPDREYP